MEEAFKEIALSVALATEAAAVLIVAFGAFSDLPKPCVRVIHRYRKSLLELTRFTRYTHQRRAVPNIPVTEEHPANNNNQIREHYHESEIHRSDCGPFASGVYHHGCAKSHNGLRQGYDVLDVQNLHLETRHAGEEPANGPADH
jgi:hypothetical protein